jgi:hypothetical protein
MLLGLVRPVKRRGSSMSYFIQRIPADVRPLSTGRTLYIPIGDQTHRVTITQRADAVRVSLRTRDPVETKVREARVIAYLEGVWRALRQDRPIALTHAQATALAGELYRAWADRAEREQTLAIEWTPQGWVNVTVDERDEAASFGAATTLLDKIADADNASELEAALGPLVDRLLLAKGISEVDDDIRSCCSGRSFLGCETRWGAARGTRRATTLRTRKPTLSRMEARRPSNRTSVLWFIAKTIAHGARRGLVERGQGCRSETRHL